MSTSVAVTNGVRVEVRSRYLAQRSEPASGRWLFAYTIRISNEGSTPVQLVSRHWVITDAHGRVEEVQGPGVVGHQPILGAGESFEYTSYCPLPTPFGSMTGTYRMLANSGETFDAAIAPFALTEPYAVN